MAIAKLVGVEFKVWGAYVLPDQTKYKYDLKEDTLQVWLKEPIPFDYKTVYEIEDEIKMTSFEHLLRKDQPFSVELKGFHAEENGLPHHIEFAIPAYIRQVNRPTEWRNMNNDTVYKIVDANQQDAELVRELTQANKNGKSIGYIIDCLNSGWKDARREFEHYYEIVDLFKGKYGQDQNICAKLQIDISSWRKFMRVLNTSEYFQSKHKGMSWGGNTWAPDEDVWFARNMIKEIVLKYLRCDKTEE